jgi:hypothetical protein
MFDCSVGTNARSPVVVPFGLVLRSTHQEVPPADLEPDVPSHPTSQLIQCQENPTGAECWLPKKTSPFSQIFCTKCFMVKMVSYLQEKKTAPPALPEIQ